MLLVDFLPLFISPQTVDMPTKVLLARSKTKNQESKSM